MLRIVDKNTGESLTTIRSRTNEEEVKLATRELQRWGENYFKGRRADATQLEITNR